MKNRHGLEPKQGQHVIVSTHARQYRAYITGILPGSANLSGASFLGYECEPGTRTLKFPAVKVSGHVDSIVDIV